MKTTSLLTVAVVALIAGPALADSPATLEGNWQGFLRPNPAAEIRLVLRVEKAADGTMKAKVESPDFQKMATIPFDAVSLQDGAVSISSKEKGFEFQGKLDPAKNEMVGEWKKGDKGLPLTFARVEGAVVPPDIWEGSLDVGAIKIRLVFRVGKLKGDVLWATMDSPDQGAFGFRADSVAIDKDKLSVAVKAIGGQYEGKIDSVGTSAVGQWKQGGTSFPLTLKKVAEVTEARRPQVPKPPFSYLAEEVAYDSRTAGNRIAGTLTRPMGNGPFPAVLLISGSGPQDRDETLLGHKPFLVLADDLTRRGIAVLRVDDRGVGASTGDHARATTADFAEDALAGVDYLRHRPEIDPKRIGLIGHSEGGLIAPMVAIRSPDVAFIVLMAGPGLPGDEIIMTQQALILRTMGMEEEKIREQTNLVKRLIVIVKANEDLTVAREKMRASVAEVAAALPEKERKALAEADPNGIQTTRLASPWFRFFLTFDPRPSLAKVACPVLAINGEKDLQVAPKENLKAIDQAVRSGGNKRVTVQELPGLNHLFQTSTTGAPSEYGTIEETIAPAALRTIGDWIIEQTRPRE